jgi:hypothetical protein
VWGWEENERQGGLALPRRKVAPLETFSTKESFLGITSSLLGYGRLAMHGNSPGSLCHATQASAWGYPSRVSCLTGLVCACGDGYLGIMSGLVRQPFGQVFHSVNNNQ